MPAMPNFLGAPYGPLALSGLLRQVREPGERLIAWGVVEVTRVAGARETARSLTVVLGPLGAIAGLMVGGQTQRVAVLTDRRLLLLTTGRLGPSPEGLGVWLSTGLGELRVSAEKAGVVIFGLETGGRRRLVVKEPTSRDGARLAAALHALASPG